MMISGLQSTNLYNYNRIRQVNPVEPEGQVKRLDQVENGNQVKTQTNENSSVVTSENRELLSSRQVRDFAVNADMNAPKELIGRDSSLEGLDVQKAISDMKRDSVLQEYQIFVQSPESQENLDGTVIRKN